jgi:Mg-chelatase subunit ChlD
MSPKRLNKTRLILLSAALLAGAAILVGPARARANTPKPNVVNTPDVPDQPLPQQAQFQVPAPPQPAAEPERPRIEVVFVLDTTGSMGGLIEGAKQKIWSIASEIARGQPTPVLEVGLVAYRDRGDDYVTKKFALTRDLDAMFVNLQKLRADGGGDTPEHVGRALGEAVSQMAWNQDSKVMKLIYLVGDAPPHDDYRDGWNSVVWAKRAADKGITVLAIRCGDDSDTSRAFTRIASAASGSFITIGQTGGMVATASPYDAELKRLNAEIAAKTMYGGDRAAREATRAKVATMAAMPAPAAADRASFFGKGMGAGLASTAAPAAEGGAVDLTSAPAKAAAMPASALPEPLQSLSSGERQAKLEEMQKERTQLEQKAADVARQRADWLEKNTKDKDDAFDTKVKDSLKKKAADYGVKY